MLLQRNLPKHPLSASQVDCGKRFLRKNRRLIQCYAARRHQSSVHFRGEQFRLRSLSVGWRWRQQKPMANIFSRHQEVRGADNVLQSATHRSHALTGCQSTQTRRLGPGSRMLLHVPVRQRLHYRQPCNPTVRQAWLPDRCCSWD